MAVRSSTVDMASAEASGYLLEASLDVSHVSREPDGSVTEAKDWTTLKPTGDIQKDMLNFYELEYKYSVIAGDRVRMSPRRRETILARMEDQAKALGAAIAEASLPTFESWIQAHDLEHLDVMGAERMRKLQKLYHTKGKTSNIHDWVTKQHTTGVSMRAVTAEEWLQAIAGDEAQALRLALELLHEEEFADEGDFEWFVKEVVVRNPIGTMRRAIKQVSPDEQEAVVLQMFQTVYPIGYRRRLGATSERVGKNITAAYHILEKVQVGEIDAPEIFTRINWAFNVVHQAGKMADHVAKDMGISVAYLNKLSNLDTSAWDAELETMSTPRGSVAESDGQMINGWYDTRDNEFHSVGGVNTHAKYAMTTTDTPVWEDAWNKMFEKGYFRVVQEVADELGLEVDPRVTDIRSVQKILDIVPVGIENIVIDFRRNYQVVASVMISMDEFADATSWAPLIVGASKGAAYFESVAYGAETYLAEQIGQGEWWIDDMGTAQFADGDIGDYNHAMVALESILANEDVDFEDPNVPEIFAMEPLSREAREYLKLEGVNPKVIKFLSAAGDPREWMIMHHGWIRLAGSAAQMMEWDDATLGALRDGVYEAWLSYDEEIDPDDYVTIEEYRTHDTFDVSLKDLMNDRYDAAMLRRIGTGGAEWAATVSDFTKAAWARKAAGERGIGEADEDDPVNRGEDDPFDWYDPFDTDDDVDWNAAFIKWLRTRPPKKMKLLPAFHPSWEIPSKLARSSRPGYPLRKVIPVEKVDEWIDGAKKAGIRSIIVLLGPDQLPMYKGVPGGLIKYYRRNGFKVAHVPTLDKHRVFLRAKVKVPKGVRWLSNADLKKAYAAYRRLPKPVLVHCSAGIDRSGVVVRYIRNRELGKVESVDLAESSADASSYLLEKLGQFKYEVPDDKEKQLYDFYMMTYLPNTSLKAPDPGVKPEPGVMYEPVDMVYALDEARKDLVPYLKSNLLNAAFYSIACEARYIFEKTGANANEIVAGVKNNVQIKPILQNYKFDSDMAARVSKYWKEYRHFAKHPVATGKSIEAPGVVPEVLGDIAQSDRNASYRAALTAFEGRIQDFVRFASWGFWDRPWSGFNKRAYIKALKNNDKDAMKAASGSFGGGNWGRIADGWLKLHSAKGLKQDTIYVDHLYSLQHNTGAVLNKVSSYAKNGRFTWIDRALTRKFEAESPYELVNNISSGMRQLAMPIIKAWHGTTLDQWAKDNPTKAAAMATKAAGKGDHGTPSAAMGDGSKKDYVRTKTLATRPSMKKSLLQWYHEVNLDNVEAIFAAAEKQYGFSLMKKWHFPVTTVASTKVKSSPPMVMGQYAPLVKVENGVLGTSDKHIYFDKDKPGVSWMSAKHLGIKLELTHFKKETAAAPPPKPKPFMYPPKGIPPAKPPEMSPGLKVPPAYVIAKMGFPGPEGPPVDISGIQSAVQKLIASPINDVYVEVFQPASKIPAIKAIRMTYGMILKDAKKVVDFAEKNKEAPKGVHPDDGYLKFWWPNGDLVTLGEDVVQHPQAHWGEAEVAYAVLLSGNWEFLRSDGNIKMINVNNRWYVPATRVMDSNLIEQTAVASAPKLGDQMTRVVKLGATKPTLISLLQQTFKVGQTDAWAAVNAIPIGKLSDMAWIDYAPGTLAFAPGKFNKRAPVSVAMWNPGSKSVVPVEMAAWWTTDPSRIFVMDDAVQATMKVVSEAPAKPIDVHEGKVMYTVHDHGVGNTKLAGPFDDVGEVGEVALKMKKSYPHVGINEFIFINGEWQLLRQYGPDWKGISTNVPVFNQVKAKGGVKPKPEVPGPSLKPEDVGIHFKIRVEDPETKTMKYVFGNEFISWSQVEKGIAELKDPDSNIKGVPFKDAAITVEKWAHAKVWPLKGVASKLGPPTLVEMMKPVSSKTEKGKYTAVVTFIDEDWEKTDADHGPFPKDRAQAAAWAKGEIDPVERPTVDNPAVVFTVKAKKTPIGQHVAVFGNAFTHWAQVIQAIESMKDPGSGIVGAPIADSDILIEKWANPIAWPPSVDVSKYRLDTSKPIKVEEIDFQGNIKWVHPAWSEVVEVMTKKPGAPWYTGNLPYTVTGAIELSKVAAAEQSVKKVLTQEKATMTVADALMLLPDISYEASVALNVHPDDALLSDVWSDLSLDAQSDIQIAIGKTSAEALEKKRADIYKVYPTVRDDVRYVVKLGIGVGQNFPGGKTPESAMEQAEFKSKHYTGVTTIIKQVEVSKGVFRNLHMFEPSGTLVTQDKAYLDPNVSTNKFTGLRKGVPHKFVFIGADGKVTDLDSSDFPVALEEANQLKAELQGDMLVSMYLWVQKDVFFKITGKVIGGNNVWAVQYGLPEGYIKYVYDVWAEATGLKKSVKKKEPTPTEPEAGLTNVLVGTAIDTLELDYEAQGDISSSADSSDDTVGDVWGALTDHTKVELINAWREHRKKAEPFIKEKPWNAWTVQEAIQLPLSDEAKAELKKYGGGMVLGEVMGTIPLPLHNEIMVAVDEFQAEPEPEVTKRVADQKDQNIPSDAKYAWYWEVYDLDGAVVAEADHLYSTYGDAKKYAVENHGRLGEYTYGVLGYTTKDNYTKLTGSYYPYAEKWVYVKKYGMNNMVIYMDRVWRKVSGPLGLPAPSSEELTPKKPKKKAPKKKPKKKIKEPASDAMTTELTFGQVRELFDVPEDAQNMLNQLQKGAEASDLVSIGNVWSMLSMAERSDIESAYYDWKIEKSKVPQEEPEGGQVAKAKLKKKAKKKKALKKPTDVGAMKALQSWKIVDVVKYLGLFQSAVDEIDEKSIDSKQSIMSIWSNLTTYTQDEIIKAWIVHKSEKQAKPKKPEKGKKVPTHAQAEKHVKTWKIASVLLFLDPSVHDGVYAAQSMTGKISTDKIADVWDAMTIPSRNNLVSAYIKFMKKKHGLESVSADASCYLLEEKKKTFPRIVRRAHGDAEGGLDLYFVRFREDGREYCYALSPSLRPYIKKIEDVSGRKAASIVKAKSDGEYDCDTGRSKRLNVQADDELVDESAEASMYVLDEAIIVDTVYRSDLTPILEAMDDHDDAMVAVEKPPPRGLSASDKKVRKELQSNEYPATVEDGKAFVFHWADGRGACAFKHKKDAIAWINDDVNCPNGPDIVGWWYDQPYCPKSKRDKKHRLRVAGGYTPVKPKKGRRTEAVDPEVAAEREFGLTDDPREAGYILTDGNMLDFSGKREGGSSGTRAYDHRDIGRATERGGSEGMIDFMSLGNIRAMPEAGGLDMVREPTGRQYRVIEYWVLFFHGDVIVDINDEQGRVIATEEFIGASPAMVVGFIKRHFNPMESVVEDVDRDTEADRMLDRYGEEPTSIWMYTDMPVKDRVAWAYLAADRFKGVDGEDLVARFIETLRQVVDDPETFWQQIRDKDAIRANYLDHLDWDIETVPLKDIGVYPRFSGFSDEVCEGNVIETAAAIETTGDLPERVAKLREMSDVWMTVLKFLPPILVPGGILRSERPGYEVLKWTCDDGNHRLVSAAMAGAEEAVCFVGTQKKERIEPAHLVIAGQAESTVMGMVT